MHSISQTVWAFRNKITNKLSGVVHMPATSERRGNVLISYITEPFALFPWERFSNYHTMYWECHEIARLFSEKGYAVDIVNATNATFIPRKKYVVCIDIGNGLERFSKYLPKECVKVFHTLSAYWQALNDAEETRLEDIKVRRGVELLPHRTMAPSRNAEVADLIEGFGNRTIFNTFEKFGKPLYFIPISSVITYDFPDTKDLEKAKKEFLWIGGGGLVLKGLDLVLEAFAKTPELKLHVCGPIHGEEDFVRAYYKELYETSNIKVHGRLDVSSEEFKGVLSQCAAIVYPSASEGTSGAVVQAMHAGLVPLITDTTGIQEDAGYIPLEKPTPQSIATAAHTFTNMPREKIHELSYRIWLYARAHYTRVEFSKAYRNFIEKNINL